MKKQIVILDAGHGINTPGKRTPKFKYGTNDILTYILEYEINIAYVLELQKILSVYSIETALTSNELTDKSLANRMKSVRQIVNDNKSAEAIFVSIHANAFGNGVVFTNPNGIEFLYSPKMLDNQILANQICDKFNGRFLDDRSAYKNRGLKKRTDLYVLNNSPVASCLVEVGFMTNKQELDLLLDAEYRNTMCLNIANGILQYFKIKQ